jgi:hypothetical protein
MIAIKRLEYVSNEYAQFVVNGKIEGRIIPGETIAFPEEPFKVTSSARITSSTNVMLLDVGVVYQLEAAKPKRRAKKNEKS